MEYVDWLNKHLKTGIDTLVFITSRYRSITAPEIRMFATYDLALKEILELLKRGSLNTPRELELIKVSVAKKYGLSRIPSNSEILSKLDQREIESFGRILRVKSTRSASGVVVVAVMTEPAPCPHGRCIYCPGGPSENLPQSYTGHEPAAMRGTQYNYDPYLQTKARIEQLKRIGHPTHKVEIIIMGGTFTSRSTEYQRYFVKRILDALNGVESRDLEEAKLIAEKAEIRNVGLTVETRPDWCKEREVDMMLDYTTTRVEIGVQTVFPEILELVGRRHSVEDTIEAIRIAKDSGLKVGVHMMPGLPSTSYEKDLEAFRILFFDKRYMPDMLKIYPTLVIKGTKLYEMWKRGEYDPLDESTAVDLVSEVLAMAPSWVRVMRVQRDIPSKLIQAGPRKGNLRELAVQKLMREGRECKEIRSREAGLAILRQGPRYKDLVLRDCEYEASDGKEHFLCWESDDGRILFGYLRMRIPSARAHRPELAACRCAIIRELKVLGLPAPFGRRVEGSYQHIGLGRSLLSEAESKAMELGVEKILVTSAVGAREYYYRLGYRPEGPYVSKMLS